MAASNPKSLDVHGQVAGQPVLSERFYVHFNDDGQFRERQG